MPPHAGLMLHTQCHVADTAPFLQNLDSLCACLLQQLCAPNFVYINGMWVAHVELSLLALLNACRHFMKSWSMHCAHTQHSCYWV